MAAKGDDGGFSVFGHVCAHFFKALSVSPHILAHKYRGKPRLDKAAASHRTPRIGCADLISNIHQFRRNGLFAQDAAEERPLLAVGNVRSWIALPGQAAAQLPQPWHLAASISAFPSALTTAL